MLYDGDCGVCRLTALALNRLDWARRLDLVPLQSFSGDARTDGPSRSTLLAALHVRDADGEWTSAGAAAVRIAAAVPLLAPLALVAHLPGGRWLAEQAYRLVAANRQGISRALNLDRCARDLRPAPNRAER